MLINLPLEWCSMTYDVMDMLLKGVLAFIPKLIGALVVFVVGWIVSVGIGRLITEVLNKLKFNEIFDKAGWGNAFRKAELKVNAAEFFGAVIKWVLVIAFLLVSVEILGFLQFAVFLRGVLAFLPNVIVAALIFVVATVLADVSQKVTVASIEKAETGYAKVAGLFVKSAILGFAIMAILVQLRIGRELLIILFQGIVALFVISFGLAFGLGGKDVAAETLRSLKEKLK